MTIVSLKHKIYIFKCCPKPSTTTDVTKPFTYLIRNLTHIKLKKGNVLFKDALNTFYLWLYSMRHMVKTTQIVIEETCF